MLWAKEKPSVKLHYSKLSEEIRDKDLLIDFEERESSKITISIPENQDFTDFKSGFTPEIDQTPSIVEYLKTRSCKKPCGIKKIKRNALINQIIMKRDKGIPKRPMNAFFRYKRAVRERIIKEFNVQKNSEIASITANMWAEEDPEVKLFYAKETEREFTEFRRKNPAYIWPSPYEKPKLSVDLSETIVFDPQFLKFTTGFTPSIDRCEPILDYINQMP
ncbi:hypothetical protein HDV04_003841 [Boothiomyces sp. JEL0838]|nr:hypothetical protein HDV04_003841 [Boothiomyces sp. JEL0838]